MLHKYEKLQKRNTKVELHIDDVPFIIIFGIVKRQYIN